MVWFCVLVGVCVLVVGGCLLVGREVTGVFEFFGIGYGWGEDVGGFV